MPPRVKIEREDIIKTALEVLKNNGEEALNARNIANLLGCSTQPIFSNFKTMEELKFEAIIFAQKLYYKFEQEYIKNNNYSPYKAKSVAYITFAKNECELFKILFLNKGENPLNAQLQQILIENFNFKEETAKLFNIEMWAFVHGMAVMSANANFPLHDSLINRIFDDAFNGIKAQFNINE